VKYFNFIAALLLSIVYASGKIPPSEGFNLWVTSFIIPVALAINHVLLVVSLFLRKKSTFYYVVSLLIGIPYLTSTIGIKHFVNNVEKSNQTFSVVNFNMGGYRIQPYHYKNRDSARVVLKNWVLHSDADISCFQEFANIPWSKEFNVIDQLKAQGAHYYFSAEGQTSHDNHYKHGILIISKYPIVQSGDLLASKNGFNRIAYADIKLGEDTIRIVNVHLESMGLGQVHPRNARDLTTVKTQIRIILSKLKVGVFERSKQIQELAAFVETSPHPVICVGDFNDLPYSFNYRYLKKTMKNSFEESGKGFGFTYNGGTLKLIRIDNQFFSSKIQSVGFQTMDSIRLSDHFPLRGEYQIKREKDGNN
jgi:endonuclease/exonuclease/phosphatase family metal-dependent hydrolase